MTDGLDAKSADQIATLCSQEIFKDSRIAIMPDCHAGKGCVIGFTARVKDRIIPNLVGVDISCSISTYKIDTRTVDFGQLNRYITRDVPHGTWVRKDVSALVDADMQDMVAEVCRDIGDETRLGRDLRSIGSLGGGNHFLEVNRDTEGALWFSIHCGSRNLGARICEFHQEKAMAAHPALGELAYLEGDDLDLYVKHMKVAQRFAALNHAVILHEVSRNMGWAAVDSIFTNHNYIEFLDGRDMMIRKGAISAKQGERLIIPMNMRDGSLIGTGKGNAAWNCSSPHGAGRLLSRTQAFKQLKLEEFKTQMAGVWSSCVGQGTLDESPMVYKPMEDILAHVGETVEIQDRIVPLYNFKAS